MLPVLTYPLVLIAHNGFGFDFLFLIAEIQRRQLVEAYNTVDVWFADTLCEARKVSRTSIYPQCIFTIQLL